MSIIPQGDEPKFEEMQKVVELYVQNINPTAIAKQVGIRRVDVLNHIEDWRKSAIHSEIMEERVRELLATMDEHFGILIQKAYEVIDEVDQDMNESKGRSQMLAQKLASLRMIADAESKRIDLLQKSGLLDAAGLGDELEEMERQKELILSILETELCDNCQIKVQSRLAGEMGNTVVVVHETGRE